MASPFDRVPKNMSYRRYGEETPVDIALRNPKYRKGLLVDGVWF